MVRRGPYLDDEEDGGGRVKGSVVESDDSGAPGTKQVPYLERAKGKERERGEGRESLPRNTNRLWCWESKHA